MNELTLRRPLMVGWQKVFDLTHTVASFINVNIAYDAKTLNLIVAANIESVIKMWLIVQH